MTDPTTSPRTPADPAREERERVDALNALAVASMDEDPRRALRHAHEARDAASSIGYEAGLAAAVARSGLLHRVLGEHERARLDALQALELYEALDDRSGRARMMSLLGRVEFVRGNHAEGLAHLFPALELAQEIGDLQAQTTTLYNLAYGYHLLDDHAASLDFARRALLIDRQIGDRCGEARELNVIAVSQRELGSVDEAVASARESLEIAREGGCRLVEGLALSTLCEIYEELDDYDRAVDFCGQSLALGREFGFDTPQLAGLIRLGGIYRKAGEIDRSIEHYQATLEFAERVENRKDVMTCHRALSELFELQGDLPSALAHQRRYSEVREAMFNEAHDRKIEALEARHRTETARKEAEIYQLRNVALEQEIADRKRAEDELRAYKEHLEEQVAQRTTELTEANERLRASEERYRTLYEDTPSMYFTIDPAGTVLSVNAFGAEQLGYRPEELLGESVFEVFVEEDREAAAGHVANCLAEPDQVFHWELRKVRKDGSRLTVRETARVIDRDGRPVVLIVCEDISEQKRAEQTQARLEAELRQAQKLEAIGRLAGGVAHDFNNLLTAMIGYLELVVAGLEPGSPVRQDAEEARRTVERATTLTNQLLAFSRRQPIRPAAVDLNEVVRNMEKLLRPLIGEDIELVTVLDPDLAPVHADRGQLEQVIVNLAANARDAMPKGGKLLIETANGESDGRRPPVGDRPAGSFVLLSVTDTGTGMDDGTRTRVFEPFFTTKEQGKGTGLGLSTVYGIVERHHGWISVAEGPGATGTAVRIWLPRSVASAVSPVSPGPVRDERGSETILLVEDEEIIRSLAARVLRGHGYVVLEARNADEALRLASERPAEIDLALSDVVMPGVGGHEFAELLRARHPEVRVVLMSGYDKAFGEGSPHLPADPVALSKPFTPAALLRTVRSALDAQES
jgi:two-component system cell cycle sensor histidine kinase/response regulator CckA